MDTPVTTVAQADPDADLPEDIRRIPPEFRDAELRRLAEHPTKQEQEYHEMETRALCEFYGIPYP
jgi:hypothetical protein